MSYQFRTEQERANFVSLGAKKDFNATQRLVFIKLYFWNFLACNLKIVHLLRTCLRFFTCHRCLHFYTWLTCPHFFTCLTCPHFSRALRALTFTWLTCFNFWSTFIFYVPFVPSFFFALIFYLCICYQCLSSIFTSLKLVYFAWLFLFLKQKILITYNAEENNKA